MGDLNSAGDMACSNTLLMSHQPRYGEYHIRAVSYSDAVLVLFSLSLGWVSSQEKLKSLYLADLRCLIRTSVKVRLPWWLRR